MARVRRKPTAIDLFCGCGGLSLGLARAGFRVLAAVDSDPLAIATYRKNHKRVRAICDDIRSVTPANLLKLLALKPGELSLLAGCPPCQGFSTLRTMNGGRRVRDSLNKLLFEFVRFVRVLRPQAIMIENVPKLAKGWQYWMFRRRIKKLGYRVRVGVFDAADFGVPQRRKRMILVGMKTKQIEFAKASTTKLTVKSAIGALTHPSRSRDTVHNYPVARAREVKARIRQIPKNGGSRGDLSTKNQLPCHKKINGFRDIYGRMSWSEPSPTITGGCINPSKGRFLHPTHNRAITLREAALLQGFPRKYYFQMSNGRYPVAQLIGNAFPPEFAARHANQIRERLKSQ